LALAMGFAACDDAVETDETGTASSAATTGPAASSSGSGGASASSSSASAGGSTSGAGGAGGAAGAGGGSACGSVPMPVGFCTVPPPMSTSGGTSGSSGAGGAATSCETGCDDAASNSYSVACDLNAGTCACKYNGATMCSCSQAGVSCSEHCCPAPWGPQAVCATPPPQVGACILGGGSAASNGSGGFVCESSCQDGDGNDFSVECSDSGKQCVCSFQGWPVCSCDQPQGATCGNHCCPSEWDGVPSGAGGGGGAGGAGGGFGSVGTTGTSGTTGN
jgi:hypothetical protein